MGEMLNVHKILVERSEGKKPFERLGIDWRIILERILKKQVGSMWPGFIWLRTGTGGDCCEHGNEPSGSIKGAEFLD
jgi:hypothetical protein